MTFVKLKTAPSRQTAPVRPASGRTKPAVQSVLPFPVHHRPARRAAVKAVQVNPFDVQGREELVRLDRELLAPSYLSVALTAVRTLFPAFAGFLVLGSLAASAAGYSPLMFLEQGLSSAQALEDMPLQLADEESIVAEEESEEEQGAAPSETLEEPQAETAELLTASQAPTDTLDVGAQISQVNFISGLIAVHRPSIGDCGKVARDIVSLSAKEDLDPLFVAAIISIESRFGANARSHAGALGLMQLLPQTAREVSNRKTGKKSYPLLTDSHTNIALGIHYIKELEKRYSGNRFYALAAYNWGPANVDRALSGRSRMPKSVRSYANTILERSVRWRKHFNQANKSAEALGKSYAQTQVQAKQS